MIYLDETNTKSLEDEKEMTLHYIGGKTAKCRIEKETRKYIVFRSEGWNMKYRLNKETGEVQDGTYHNVLKGLYVDIDDK